MCNEDFTMNALIDLLGSPSFIVKDGNGNFLRVCWDGGFLDDGSFFYMKVDVQERTVAIKVEGSSPGDWETFRYRVDNLMTAHRIYQYFLLNPSDFAWDCGLVLHHDEDAGDWSATDENGTILYREMDAFEVKNAIFEAITGLRVENQ